MNTSTNNDPLSVAIVSTSMRLNARSRRLAGHLTGLVAAAGAVSDLIDLSATPLPLYDGGELTSDQAEVVERIASADAFVFCVGVYNAGVNSSAHNLMHWALNPEGPKHKPFFFAVSAGSTSSLYATDALARSLLQEIGAVQVSPPCFVTDDADVADASGLAPELKRRTTLAVRALVVFGLASRQLRAEPALG